MNESISTRIKEVCKSLHMSQVEFAKFLGITQATVSGIESGNQIPGTDTALKIAKKCNVSMDWLCGLSSKKSAPGTPETYSDVAGLLIALMELPITQYKIVDPHQLSLIFCDEKLAKFFKDEAIMSEVRKKDQLAYDAWINDAYERLNYPIANITNSQV